MVKRIVVVDAPILPTDQVNMTMSQTVLPFKLSATAESLTAHAGLVLIGEYMEALGLASLIDHELPGPGSAIGYEASAFVEPLVLLLHGGGRTLEDLRVLRGESGLLRLLQWNLPSSEMCIRDSHDVLHL